MRFIKKLIDEILTISEAAAIWGKEESSLRRVLKGGKFIIDIDCRKSGNTWIVTRESLLRVYGEPKKEEKNMENRMIEIRKKVLERVKNIDITENGEITREEYYYCVGRSVAILQKYSILKENINKFLNTSSVEVLRNYKISLFKKHLEEFLKFTERYSVEWNIVAVSYSYDPESYTKSDKDILMFGYLDTAK